VVNPIDALGLTGIGASVTVSTLRRGPVGYKLPLSRLSGSVAVVQGDVGEDGDYSSVQILGTPVALSSALSALQFQPATRWLGLGLGSGLGLEFKNSRLRLGYS
jgi:hypothetical protein